MEREARRVDEVFDTDLYRKLRREFDTLAISGGDHEDQLKKIGARLTLMDVLGTCRVNAKIALASCGDDAKAQKHAQAALDDATFALTTLQRVIVDGDL